MTAWGGDTQFPADRVNRDIFHRTTTVVGLGVEGVETWVWFDTATVRIGKNPASKKNGIKIITIYILFFTSDTTKTVPDGKSYCTVAQKNARSHHKVNAFRIVTNFYDFIICHDAEKYIICSGDSFQRGSRH